MTFSFRMGEASFTERNTSQVKRVLLLCFIFLKPTAERLIVRPTLFVLGTWAVHNVSLISRTKDSFIRGGPGTWQLQVRASAGHYFAGKEQEIDYSYGVSCLTLFNLTQVRLASFKTYPSMLNGNPRCLFLMRDLGQKM